MVGFVVRVCCVLMLWGAIAEAVCWTNWTEGLSLLEASFLLNCVEAIKVLVRLQQFNRILHFSPLQCHFFIFCHFSVYLSVILQLSLFLTFAIIFPQKTCNSAHLILRPSFLIMVLWNFRRQLILFNLCRLMRRQLLGWKIPFCFGLLFARWPW